jgi:hypothetical protein
MLGHIVLAQGPGGAGDDPELAEVAAAGRTDGDVSLERESLACGEPPVQVLGDKLDDLAAG